MPLPNGLLIEAGFSSVGFASGARAPASSIVWTNITNYAMGFTTTRGRSAETDLCEPGEMSVVLLNTDGRFDNDNPDSPYVGSLVPNRQIRISALNNASVRKYLSFCYANAWNREWPGGSLYSLTELLATDRFKLLAKRQNTGTTIQEQSHARIKAILDAGNTDGPNCLVPTAEYSLNPDLYACRTLVAHIYTEANSLSNLKEVATSDGGALFVAGNGVLTFQSTRFRTDNIRSTTSQATFGNSTTATVPLSADDPPKLLNDDVRIANYVRVQDGRGKEYIAQDATSIAANDRFELDIGGTLLRPADAPDRVADILSIRKDFSPRYESLTVDCYGSNAALQQALDREISDRITVAIIPRGQTRGTSRPYIIEGVSHRVTTTSWKTTFKLSPVGAATVITT